MTDISINAGLPASLTPQCLSVNGSNAADTATAKETGFFAALQSAPSTGASQYEVSRTAESPSVSHSVSEQSGYAQTEPSASADTSVKVSAENGTAAQTATVYDGCSKAEEITVSPETVEELKSILAEKADNPTAYQQAKEALEAAMLKAINDMNDPEVQKEKAQEKLLLALMKFLDKLLNKEPERDTALDDGEEDKEFKGILLEIVERMVESARENQKPDDDLDGNAPLLDMFIPQPQIEDNADNIGLEVEIEKVPTTGRLTGLDQFLTNRLMTNRFPSLKRAMAAMANEPIPVPIVPRVYEVMGEETVADEMQTEEPLTVQNTVLPFHRADEEEIVSRFTWSNDGTIPPVRTIPLMGLEDTAVNAAETSGTEQTTEVVLPAENVTPAAPEADDVTASVSGTQQTQNTQEVSSAVEVDPVDDVTDVQNVEAVAKVQENEFDFTGGGWFVIEFLPDGSEVIQNTTWITDEPDETKVEQPDDEDLSNAPADPSDETVTEAPDKDGGDQNVTDIDTDTRDDYVPETEENTSTDASQKPTDDAATAKTDNVPLISDGDEDTAYERMAETVYAETIGALTGKQVKTVQPTADYAAVEKTGEAQSAVFSDELDELSRLFGVKKEPETRVLPIDDEETDNASEISKELPVEQISVVSSKVPDAPEARSFDLGEGTIRQVVTQIVTEVLHNLPEKDGETTLMMTLNPESLGRISVKLVENAGKLTVTIVAENKETAAMLASRYDQIHESLRDNGTQLEKYQVVYGAEQDGRAEQQNYEGSSKNPYVRQDEEHDEDNNGQFRELLGDAV